MHSIIIRFFSGELNPVIKEIQTLAVESSSFKLNLLECFVRNKINRLENQYIEISTRFIEVYQKWSNPDKLFESIKLPDDKNKDALMADYSGMKEAIKEHFEEGFRLLGFIDRVLTARSTASYNCVAVILSILAITISGIIAIFSQN